MPSRPSYRHDSNCSAVSLLIDALRLILRDRLCPSIFSNGAEEQRTPSSGLIGGDPIGLQEPSGCCVAPPIEIAGYLKNTEDVTMAKENDLEGRQDMGGKHGGQAGMPKPERQGAPPSQGIVRDEKGQEQPADKRRARQADGSANSS
jgi:hypothetical protein